jgi:hypothetical protein
MLTIISEKKSGGEIVVEAPVKKTTRGKTK